MFSLRDFVRDENGQGMVEYALILALIAVVVLVALRAVGETVNRAYQDEILTNALK